MILLPTLAVAFAALCIWLTVRIVNRRERWAKWTLAGVVALAYVASIGPWYYVAARIGFDSPIVERTAWLYVPLLAAEVYVLPESIGRPYHDYHVWWHHQGMIARFQEEWNR